jgi:6-phospho-beta-glucosidase
MEDHAPNSILLNYTNPTNIVTQALLHTTPLPVVGLCDQADDELRTLAEACGYHATDIAYRCNGLHHATWYTDIQFDGVRFRLDHEKPKLSESLDEERRMRFEVCWEMACRHPGQWPNSYLAYYERPELFVALSRRLGPRTDMIVQDLDAHYERFAREALRARPDLGRYRRTSALGDQAVRAIVALGADRSRPLTLNIKNATATHQLDSETVIETVVDVDRWGVHKSGAPELPEDRVRQVRTLERYQRATAQVAVNGKHEALVDALAANPLVQDRRKADAILRRARQVYGSHIAALSGKDEDRVHRQES